MINKLLSQYAWIIKVLISCETSEQIDVAEKLFNNFIKLYKKDLNLIHQNIFIENFNKEKKIVTIKIKTKKSFISKLF